MDYFLLINYGYDGIGITKFTDEQEAKLEYARALAKTNYKATDCHYDGVALLAGTVIASKDFPFQ